MCRFGRRSRSSRSGCSFAWGSILAAASMAMIRAPFFNRTPSSSVAPRTNRGFVTCTAEKAQELLDRETRATPILLQPIPQRGIPDQLVNRSADQMGGGLRSRAQQQKDHRDYFVGADAPAFHFNAH